ncbi:MAG: DUF4258 domain-containing protein [Nitrospirota bacterium]
MSNTLEGIKELVESCDVRISEHGYDELANDNLIAREIVEGIKNAVLIEDYPNYPKGTSILVLQSDGNGNPVHVVWGIPIGHNRPAVLVTAYRPDPQRWNDSFTERKR